MALAKFKCLNCEKEFEAGSWKCADGSDHIVAEKTYYVRDAPADKRDCKNARLQILNVVPESKVILGGDTHIIPGSHVEFVRGRYATQSPQLQIGLDRHKGVFSGPEAEAQWKDDYLSDDEKVRMRDINQKALISRLENERNDLLSKVQAQVKRTA